MQQRGWHANGEHGTYASHFDGFEPLPCLAEAASLPAGVMLVPLFGVFDFGLCLLPADPCLWYSRSVTYTAVVSLQRF